MDGVIVLGTGGRHYLLEKFPEFLTGNVQGFYTSAFLPVITFVAAYRGLLTLMMMMMMIMYSPLVCTKLPIETWRVVVVWTVIVLSNLEL